MRTVFLLLLLALPALAQDPLPAVVSQFIDDQTVVVARVDLAKLDVDTVFQRVGVAAPDADAVAAVKQIVSGVIADLKKTNVGTLYALANMADATANPLSFVIPITAEADGPNVIASLKKFPGGSKISYEARKDVVLAGSEAVLTRMKTAKPSARTELNAGVAAGKDAAILVVLAPTADLRRLAEEASPNLPKELGGGPVQAVSRGLTWASIQVLTTPKLDAALTVQATDAAAAKAFDDMLKTFIKTMEEGKHGNEMTATLLKLLRPSVEKDRFTLRADEATFDKFAKDAAGPMRIAASRSKSSNNLKQLALAMHNYLDAHNGRFPADILDKDGKPMLSWRVHLLPFIEQETLYKQFKLDEPWDSANNKPLIAKMPEIFKAPEQKSAAGTTTYLGPLGEKYLFRPKAADGLKIVEITDGTSNTIMIAEVDDTLAVEWTKPADWTPDAKEPLKGLLGHYKNGFNTAFCDGSVRFVSKSVKAETLLALLTSAGGEVAELP